MVRPACRKDAVKGEGSLAECDRDRQQRKEQRERKVTPAVLFGASVFVGLFGSLG